MAIAEQRPHAVFFPFPAQGHIKPALGLAKLLHDCHGFQVTFVHTEHNHRRLLRSHGPSVLAGIPGSFQYAALPDGLPPSELDASQDMRALLCSLENVIPHFRNLVADLPPVSCVISDIEHILYAAKEMGLPCVTLWAPSACGFMASQQCQPLVDMGILPLKEGEQLRNGYLDDTVLDWVPGMPKDIRLRDFPSFIRTTDPEDDVLKVILRAMECHRTTPSAVIFHTIDELEREVIAAMSTILPPIYAVGPLPLLLSHVPGSYALESNLSKENDTCLEWLRGKRPNSVLYVSFGSITTLTNKQLVEFAWGLANSKKEFLWVIRSDQVNNGASDPAAVLPLEFLDETKERSHVTSWCPQEAVLQHEAISAFLTHCGWNSVLESISAGVPMLCWPFGSDQYTNTRYVCSEWRVGLEISSNVERNQVKAAIMEVMEGDKGKEMKRMAMEWKEKATAAAVPGGPSWVNLENVINEVMPANLDDTVLDWVPGMPKNIRLRDFPSFIRTADSEDGVLKVLLRSMACHRTTPSAVIFHTFDELEREVIAAMSTILPPIYAVGPLPLLLSHVPGSAATDTLESNLCKENDTCLEWLMGKRPNSVLYVSFGSITTLTNEQLVEFAWGLANSKKEFLWVIRSDQVNNGAGEPAVMLPPEFLEETKDRSHVTSWCPQEAVLQHEAIGAFLTHCGWNSVLESISAGVPMLCWPFGTDQYTNKRYICSEWRIGLEINSNVERGDVREAIMEVMEGDEGKEMKRMAM